MNLLTSRNFLPILAGAFILGFLGRTLVFYQGGYEPPIVPTSQFELVEPLSEPLGNRPVIVGEISGSVLVDTAHKNNFGDKELTELFGRITAAGAQIQILEDAADLRNKLRQASSFVVVANRDGYLADEVLAVEEFVHKGGRLLIVGDPTRLRNVISINSLAGDFGVIYQDDYIYNLEENDGSFVNVILRDFEKNKLTQGLNAVVFQTAYSLRVSQGALIKGDENTFSSQRERPGDVVTVGLTTNEQVLALPDLTFLTGPYNTFLDNDRFIDNIVSFLVNAERSYELLDFPYYFNDTVAVVYEEGSLLDATFGDWTSLRETLAQNGIKAVLKEDVDMEQALVYMGLFDELSDQVLDILEFEGIFLPSESADNLGENDASNGDKQIRIEGIGSLARQSKVLFHLLKEGGNYHLFIVAEDPESLSSGLMMLFNEDLDECLLSTITALCDISILVTPTATSDPSATPTPTEPPLSIEFQGEVTSPPTSTSTAETPEPTLTATPEPTPKATPSPTP